MTVRAFESPGPGPVPATRWPREIGVVGACLLASLAVGLGASIVGAAAATGLVVGTASSVWVLRHPGRALVAVAPALLLLPASIPVGSAARLPLGVALVALVIGAWAAGAAVRREPVLRSPGTIAAALLAASFLVALVAGQRRLFAMSPAPLTAQIGSAGVVWLSCALCVVAANLAARSRLRTVLDAFFAASGVLLLLRLFGLPVPAEGATGSMLSVWVVSLGAGHALFDVDAGLARRAALAVLAVATLATAMIWSPYWLSGWVPACLVLGVLALVRFPRTAAVLGAALALVFRNALSRGIEQTVAMNDWSQETRLEAWRIIGDLTLESPLFGLGPANYYQYVSQRPILGWYVPFSSHNQYVDAFAQAGLVGLGCYIGVLVTSGVAAWHLGRSDDAFLRAFGLAATAGVVGTAAAGMLGDWVLPFPYNTGMPTLSSSLLAWLFCGLAIGLGARAR